MNSLPLSPLCCALIGFDNAGRHFHAPVMAQAVLQLMALLSRGELSKRADRWVDCTDLSA